MNYVKKQRWNFAIALKQVTSEKDSAHQNPK